MRSDERASDQTEHETTQRQSQALSPQRKAIGSLTSPISPLAMMRAPGSTTLSCRESASATSEMNSLSCDSDRNSGTCAATHHRSGHHRVSLVKIEHRPHHHHQCHLDIVGDGSWKGRPWLRTWATHCCALAFRLPVPEGQSPVMVGYHGRPPRMLRSWVRRGCGRSGGPGDTAEPPTRSKDGSVFLLMKERSADRIFSS